MASIMEVYFLAKMNQRENIQMYFFSLRPTFGIVDWYLVVSSDWLWF